MIDSYIFVCHVSKPLLKSSRNGFSKMTLYKTIY